MRTKHTRRPKVTAFELVAIAAIAVVVLRIVYPNMFFDNQSLALFGIAAASLVIPRLWALLPPVRKLKYGDLEAEFDREIDQLVVRVEKAEAAPAPVEPPKWTGQYPPLQADFAKRFNELVSSNTSGLEKILGASILAEQMLNDTATHLELFKDGRPKSPFSTVEALAQAGLISNEERAAFREFWTIRNRVVHGAVPTVTSEQATRVLDLLWRLLRVLG